MILAFMVIIILMMIILKDENGNDYQDINMINSHWEWWWWRKKYLYFPFGLQCSLCPHRGSIWQGNFSDTENLTVLKSMLKSQWAKKNILNFPEASKSTLAFCFPRHQHTRRQNAGLQKCDTEFSAKMWHWNFCKNVTLKFLQKCDNEFSAKCDIEWM